MTKDRDRREPEAERERARATSRYSLWVGAAFVILIGIATINTLNNNEGGLLGADAAEAGEPLAEFAVPRLPGGPEGDANVFQDDCETAANPCPEEDRRTPACEVDLERVIRVCDYFDRPLVLAFWFTSPSGCPPTLDVIESAARKYDGEVNFLSIAIRGERAEIEQVIRERRWRIPVGWDRDGAVSNLYHVGLCPTVAFVFPGGILRDAAVGSDELSPAALDDEITALVRESSRRAETSR